MHASRIDCFADRDESILLAEILVVVLVCLLIILEGEKAAPD